MRYLPLLLLATPLAAQDSEIFIPGVTIDPTVQATPQTSQQAANPLARCLANPDAATCASATTDPSGVVTESATPDLQFETLVLDLDTKTVTATQAPPPQPTDYSAPQQAHGTTALPSVAVTIEFDFDSDQIRAHEFGKIASLTQAFNDPALAGTRFAVIGHTDAKGSAGYNCDLSRRRAGSVTRALQASYVTLELFPVGFGEHVLKNVYDPNAAENRRVTFLRLPDHPGAVLQTAAGVCQY